MINPDQEIKRGNGCEGWDWWMCCHLVAWGSLWILGWNLHPTELEMCQMASSWRTKEDRSYSRSYIILSFKISFSHISIYVVFRIGRSLIPPCRRQPSTTSPMTPKDPTTLKRLPALQSRPPFDGSHLHTDQPQIPIIGLEISHGRRLLLPRIPHHCILQVISHYIDARGAGLEDGGRRLRNAGVDPIGLRGYGEGRGGFGLWTGRGVESFVEIRCAHQASECGFGHILLKDLHQSHGHHQKQSFFKKKRNDSL